jgi:signal transduction histidine kinase
MSACNAVRVVSFSHISWNEYKITVVFQNLQDLYYRDVIAGDIVAQFSYTNDEFVSFEMAIRLTYSIISIFVWLYFTFITLKAQWFSKMHTQQKWLIFILFFHIWFYDPIYYLQVFIPGWVFPFIHILLATTFIFVFLLYLLIFFHSLFKKREERTFFGFYLTKILIIVSCWISIIITLTWSRLYNRDDPTITGLSQTPGFMYFEGVSVALILIYAVLLLYYIIRAIGSFRKFKKKYSTRFKIVGSFAIFVLLSMTIVTMLGDRFRYTGQGFSFLSSHTIIFLYFLYVSFLFLPTGNIEPDRKKEQERRESIEMEQEEEETQMEEDNYTEQEEKPQNLDEVSLDVDPTV